MPINRIQRYFRHGTLTRLRVFEAVARRASFTRAGEELHMAQPTVSVHMKKLAETIGVPLVQHAGKKVRLTAVGEEVYSACMRLFQTFSDLEEAIAAIHGLKAGKLRIGTTTAGECLMPQLLAAFVKKHPAIEVSLHVDSRQALLERLNQHADDLYLFANPPTADGVAIHPVLPNPIIAIAPAGHPLTRERDIPFERFAREPILMRERGSGTRLAVERLFVQNGAQPIVKMELGSNETIREAIIAGLGVSLLYRYALGFDLDSRRIAVLHVRGLPQDGHWNFIHTGTRQLSFVAQTFLAFARNGAQRIFDERMAGDGAGETKLALTPAPLPPVGRLRSRPGSAAAAGYNPPD
ncbi:MAG: LysR family transcriptional regulator [Burkholderiales bacterium]